MNLTSQIADPDSLLWKIAINDDKNAYRTLFDLFYQPLCVYARRYVDEHEAIEDFVQNVFVMLWENRKDLKIESSVRNYLLVSVKNQCLNYLKHEGYKQSYIEVYLSKSSNAGNYDELYLLTELQELLNEALSKLPETYRIIFEMSKLENKSNIEIAETLQIPLRSVERYKAKVMEALKKDLKDYLPLLLFFLN